MPAHVVLHSWFSRVPGSLHRPHGTTQMSFMGPQEWACFYDNVLSASRCGLWRRAPGVSLGVTSHVPGTHCCLGLQPPSTFA